VKEGDDADAEVAQNQKRTTSRRDLARNPRFEQVSPEVGELDEDAVDDAMGDDPDEMLALMADLVGATDQKLRELAKRLAGRLFIDVARRGPVRPRGVGLLRDLPYTPDGGDLDVDASMEAIVEGRAGGLDASRLRLRGWVKPGTGADCAPESHGAPRAAATDAPRKSRRDHVPNGLCFMAFCMCCCVRPISRKQPHDGFVMRPPRR